MSFFVLFEVNVRMFDLLDMLFLSSHISLHDCKCRVHQHRLNFILYYNHKSFWAVLLQIFPVTYVVDLSVK
jgi:hypothetical protein